MIPAPQFIVIPAPQFIVVPFTGMQICRRIPLPQFTDQEMKLVWELARQLGKQPRVRNPLLALIRNHIACDYLAPDDCTGWIACDPNEAVFFRLLRLGPDYAIDLVIDTQNGAGRTAGNLVECFVETGVLFKKQHHLATIFVEENSKPRNDVGSLILDFGNTATSAIFSARNARQLETRPIHFHNPWDPHDASEERRPIKEKSILKSTTFMLRVPETDVGSPWVVLGKQAEELIRQEPMATSLFAPKKYIRDWPDHLKAQEPTTKYRGLMGQQLGLFPKLRFVHYSLLHMVELVLSTLVNPRFGHDLPDCYPQMAEVLLTYPLTWREADKELFRGMVQTIAEQLFVLKPEVQKNFQVDLVCSEPVGVAIYALWEVLSRFFAFSPKGANLVEPSLASSMLGNLDGTPELRILVVDIGGGSTDIALLEAAWKVDSDDSGDHVEVKTRVVESLRFNRAGDRISHLMATAIMEFLRHKFGITESLDFAVPSANFDFKPSIKRQIVSRIMELVELAKVKLTSNTGPWVLPEQDEQSLHDLFQVVIPPQQGETALNAGDRLEISLAVLRQWIEEDYGSIKTNGAPGFMDIFSYLREMRRSLSVRNLLPHLIILSGRTTRLPFIKQMTAQHLAVPLHRVRTLAELLPDSLKGPDHENMDKLAVVCGAHRLRYGDPIRFIPLPEESNFRRFIGTIAGTPAGGSRINKVLVKPGDSQPATCIVRVPAAGNLLIGHTFHADGERVEVIATLSNSTRVPRDVEIEIKDDYTVTMRKSKDSAGIVITEWVPGGPSFIVDNFNDTGRIDREPERFLRNIVCHQLDQWIKPQS